MKISDIDRAIYIASKQNDTFVWSAHNDATSWDVKCGVIEHSQWCITRQVGNTEPCNCEGLIVQEPSK